MKVYLIGAGCGPDTLTAEAERALAEAGLVLGAQRLLEALRERLPAGKCVAAVRPEEIRERLRESGCGCACVLLSGDSGFYSGARRLLPLLDKEEVHVLPGISSLQLLAARLGRPWQDWRLCSAHGQDCDPVAAVCSSTSFFLTGGARGASSLCAELCAAGLGQLRVTVGEALGTAAERITACTAEAAESMQFSPLAVLLAEAAPRFPQRTPGLPDELFLRREGVPMTKRDIRAAILSRLAPTAQALCWDIGSGSGSVGVELALQARAVWGVERDKEALALSMENREKFGAWNLRLLEGTAPDILSALPRPDAVFIGGSGGRLREILEAVHAANPAARVCVSALTLETLHTACTALQELGLAPEVTQLAVSRSRAVGGLHLMLAENPVWLVTGAAR